MAYPKKATTKNGETKVEATTPITTPTPAVRVAPVNNGSNTAAMITLTFGEFAVGGIAVMWSDKYNRFFISYPSKQNKKGEWVEICHPTSKEGRNFINEVVCAELKKSIPDVDWVF